jgi:AcrR family transcriptional regulator
MSPRPRKATDEDVFEAAGRVMARVGPTRLTLADIAAEAGVTAGALVQRFGSKRELLLAFSNRVSGSTADLFAQLRADHDSPLAALGAYADCIAAMGASPSAVANHFAYLQLDLNDRDLHKRTMRQARATRAGLVGLIDAAIEVGELSASTESAALARLVEATLSGSLLAWAFYQRGTAAAWVRQDLDALLAPHRPSGGRSKRRSAPRARRRS